MEQNVGAADRRLSFYKMHGEPGDGGAGLLIPILSLRRQRQENLCGFKALVVYRTSSRIGSKATKRNHVSKHPKK